MRHVTAATEGCPALFCDGRDDLTRCDKPGPPIKMQNVSIDMHPGNHFAGHFSCSGRHTGQALVDHFITFAEERGINMANVRVVGGDGTNTVVGYNGGWMAILEARLGRSFSRVVCLCHHAELPYRALFRSLDGGTKSKDTFEGPIGQNLSGAVHELPLVTFLPLTSAELPPLSAEVEAHLSSDMKLLYQCARSVVTGDGSSVAHRIHGQLCLARWYTAQSRLLRVYMSTRRPDIKMTTLALYIVAVYVPTVINIKYRPDMIEAPRHLFEELERQRRHLDGRNLETVQRSLCGNALMAHPENVVLAMLGDDSTEIRTRAVQIVRDARERRQPGAVRQFRVSHADVNVAARHYTELTDIAQYARKADIEPPYTLPLSDEELGRLVDEPLRTRVPCHTQSTERSVQTTTISAGRVKGVKREDGYSLNKQAFRCRCKEK